MFSSILIVFLGDFLYLLTSKEGRAPEAILTTIFIEIFIFIFLNWLGFRFIYKPIEQFLTDKLSFEKVYKRISSLPYISAYWISFIGFIYTIIISVLMLTLDPTVSKDIFTIIYSIAGILVSYSIFTGIYMFFLINNFTMGLKEHIYKKFDILFPPEKVKLWQKLIAIYLSFSAVFILTIVDMYLSGIFDNIEKHRFIFMDIIFGPVVVIVIIYLITLDLKKPINLILDSFKDVRAGNFSIKTPVVSNDEFGIITADFNKMVEGLQERELIRDTFGKYVTKSVAEEVLKQKLNLTGEVRLATILFTDIENYTGISESMSPVEVVEMLNGYFSFIVETISKHNGIVNKFIGDAIFAIFNAPINDEQHAVNAIKAGLEIQELSQTRRFGNNNIKLKTRIGINSGVIVVGNIGSKDRLEYTAIGDEVNIASRLEQLNKVYDTQILVGEKTYELAKNYFNFEKIGKIELKGKTNVIDVYKVANRWHS